MLATAERVRVYWQPGCTSCLRMKEFLTKNGVPFVSVNVLANTKSPPVHSARSRRSALSEPAPRFIASIITRWSMEGTVATM